MVKNELHRKYFEWMYRLVSNGRYSKTESHRKLFHHLHNIDFVYSLPMDGNRAEDGIELRYRFAYDHENIAPVEVAATLDNTQCSVLEMLVALALRCEENLMTNPEFGDRTAKWFWVMMDSLGLCTMDDYHYEKEYVDEVIARFLTREYKRNGQGGLFTIYNCEYDLRTVEIWYQLCWYLECCVIDD